MILYALSFAAGIITVQQLSTLPELPSLISLFILSLGLACFRYWKPVFFISGFLWAVIFANSHLQDRLPALIEGALIEIEGDIVGLPRYDDRKVRFDFSISKPINRLPEKIRLSWYFPKQEIKAGQHWQFTVKLKKPHGQLNPGGFDYERWLFTNSIGATGYVRNLPLPRKIGDTPWWTSISVVRQMIADKLDQQLENSHFRGIVKAITIGERNNLSEQQWNVFRQTGTVHLLAISGLHIGLVSGLVYFIALRTGIKLSADSPQKYAAIAAILVAVFYSALAGFSLPTQRSLIMLSIAMITVLGQRNIIVRNTLGLTILAVLFFDPLAVLSAGFWLSFFAVIIIVYGMAARLGKISYLLGMAKIHWITAIGLAPFLLYYFQQVSIIAPLANFITVPLISLLIVPLCLLAVIMLYLSPIVATQIFTLVDQILQGLWLVLSELVELPYAVVSSPSPPFYAVFLALLGILILLAPRGLSNRWLGVVMLLPISFVEVSKPALGNMSLVLFDVGQGLSAIIETSNHVLVFDSGAKFSNQFDMGDAVVIPFLKSKGILNIDKLLISHGDNDHIGGAKSIIQQIRVKEILTSAPEKLSKYAPVQCRATQTWTWDAVDFEIISPVQGVLDGENNNSCVLKVNSRHGKILLTGDIEKPAEDWLLDHATDKLESDVLIAPHHGSKTSSSLAFLKKVNPQIILIPAGYKNRFSFPHQEVLERYKKINADWMNTADKGALSVKVEEKKGLTIESMRLTHGKYWNQ